MSTDEAKRLAILATFLRVYGVLTLIIFSSLFIGFAVQTPLLADEPKGALNWVIWNGIRCGNEPCHVPPMLFIIYLVWGVFFFLAAREPLACVLPQLHDVGELFPRSAHGRAGSHAHGQPLVQILHGYPVRLDPCPRDLPLATEREARYVGVALIDSIAASCRLCSATPEIRAGLFHRAHATRRACGRDQNNRRPGRRNGRKARTRRLQTAPKGPSIPCVGTSPSAGEVRKRRMAALASAHFRTP
jgi:hypothetical protein